MPLEHHQIHAAFNKAARRYEEHAVLQKEIMQRLLERAEHDADATAECVLDLGCGTGWSCDGLLAMHPKARVVAADFAEHMLKQVPKHARIQPLHCDAHLIDLPDASCDRVFSSLMLQWCNENQVFHEIQRVLKPGGVVHISTLGGLTLQELRAAWQAVDPGQPHVNVFASADQLAAGLYRLGFEEVVADSECITMTFKTLTGLMRDIKNIGGHNTHDQRRKGLMTPAMLRQLEHAYQAFVHNGVYPATYEAVYLRARKAPTDSKTIALNIRSE